MIFFISQSVSEDSDDGSVILRRVKNDPKGYYHTNAMTIYNNGPDEAVDKVLANVPEAPKVPEVPTPTITTPLITAVPSKPVYSSQDQANKVRMVNKSGIPLPDRKYSPVPKEIKVVDSAKKREIFNKNLDALQKGEENLQRKKDDRNSLPSFLTIRNRKDSTDDDDSGWTLTASNNSNDSNTNFSTGAIVRPKSYYPSIPIHSNRSSITMSSIHEEDELVNKEKSRKGSQYGSTFRTRATSVEAEYREEVEPEEPRHRSNWTRVAESAGSDQSDR